jgi:hypothetical protein
MPDVFQWLVKTRGILTTYTVEAWWTTIRNSTIQIEAESICGALAEADRILIDGDDEWIADNRECDDSDGPTNICIWDATMDRQLAERSSSALKLERSAGALLAALKQILGAYAVITGRDPIAVANNPENRDPHMTKAIAAINAAED